MISWFPKHPWIPPNSAITYSHTPFHQTKLLAKVIFENKCSFSKDPSHFLNDFITLRSRPFELVGWHIRKAQLDLELNKWVFNKSIN